ncbi:putative peptide maturation system protein [Streptosporangium becharense]|uniref:Putative peptide maturation system protein n=1 Tax=Streptosporangium becharense TaxID=1816182 RepID=A0A7W9IM13_9ACTN|nr:TIGR04500 family putative peptide maturation system protein [Streptosporangium becharense]MBB2910487.1 putative peptide maturation system protein [Streptosporangium becharense]MBB5823230.1 putative peptide maturation system protein [Streptosporangium becharense]
MVSLPPPDSSPLPASASPASPPPASSPSSLPGGRLLSDVLAHLHRLRDEEPVTARRLTTELRRAHPDVPMRLVWQQDFPGGPFHYDMLITAGDGTVSVAFAPDRALPWPLRGSRHAGEHVLLRVDGEDVTVEQAMTVLDVLWADPSLTTRLVNAALVEQELARHPVELPAAELQEAMDAFRRARGLLTVEATRAWMAERGVGDARLEEIVTAEASVARLRTRLVGGAVEDAFAADSRGWDGLRVLRARYADHEAARAAVARHAGVDREPMADREPIADRGDADRGDADVLASMIAEVLEHGADVRVERVRRRDLGPGAAGAGVGDLLGPQGREPAVTRVLEVHSAELDHVTRREIERVLFDRWLMRRRAEARLEWLWGTVPRTVALNEALRGPAGSGPARSAAGQDVGGDP